MATVQEWNKREQLCLASAVSCSGDQNWMSVSRNIKLVCGNHSESNNRPADFFSQKSCAQQYAHLLENVETPKRKKRSSEGNSRVSSPATIVETPTDLLLRKFTEERIQEVKVEIRKDQEEYAKIYAELQKIQSPQMSEEMLREMWREIEQEQEAQRIAEMKMENQLREREQKRLELQRSWRLGGAVPALMPAASLKPTQDTNTVVDMDVEEIIGVTKSIMPVQQQQQPPTATSPLLSSLLKSPTATVPPPPLSTTSSARANAPTITTLLTSGSIPQTNQPAITLNSNLIPPEKAVQLLSRPISGPPVADSINVTSMAAQQLLSPSQSAPTLSMLLERSKSVNLSNPTINIAASNTTSDIISTEPKKEEAPMDIEESKPVASITEAAGDSDEPDPNEEQQLLEVFKNIGNIDELDIDVSAVIDEEVDFLKGVDDSPNTADEAINFTGKLDATENVVAAGTKSIMPKTESQVEEIVPKVVEHSEKEEGVIKIETSSDDSNDNIPLAAVATLEHKDRSLTTPTAETTDEKSTTGGESFLKDKVESATLKNVDNVVKEDEQPSTELASPVKSEVETAKSESNSDEQEEQKIEAVTSTNVDAEIKTEKSETLPAADIEQNLKSTVDDEDEPMERYSTPTGEEKPTAAEDIKATPVKDEDNKGVAQPEYDNDIESSLSNAAPTLDEPQDRESHENEPLPPPSIVSIADTDEDSCTTDISIIAKRDEKSNSTGTPSVKPTLEKTLSSSSQTRKASTQDTSTKSSTADDSDSSSTNRASKRSLLNILSNLSASKSAQTIQRALNDDQLKHNYQKVCLRRLDFQTIKKHIENGNIRTTLELQRDLLLMTQNVCFLVPNSNATYKAAEVFKHEMQNIREFIFNTNEFETKSEKEVREIKQAATKQVRTGSRKSLRIA